LSLFLELNAWPKNQLPLYIFSFLVLEFGEFGTINY